MENRGIRLFCFPFHLGNYVLFCFSVMEKKHFVEFPLHIDLFQFQSLSSKLIFQLKTGKKK